MELPSLTQSLRIQGRVVHALILRESLTRYGRNNLGFLWMFLEPMAFTLIVAAIWVTIKDRHSISLPVIAFVITGYSSVLLWRGMPGRCMNAISSNRALMHHRNVRLIDLFAARLLLELVGVTASFVVLTLVFTLLGAMNWPENIPMVVLAWFLLFWFGAAFAILIAGLSIRSELVEKIWSPLSYLIFPISGAAFMVDWLPATVQPWVLILPMVHCTEMLREGYFGGVVRTHFNVSYVIVFAMLTTLLGLAVQRSASRNLGPE